MKEIPLTQGRFAIVDDADYAAVSHFKWYFAHGYAVRPIYMEGRRRQQGMHAFLLGTPAGHHTLHLNGNGLDNRRENLQVGTAAENGRGFRKIHSNNTSGYRGVLFSKARQKFEANLTHAGVRIFCGYHESRIAAACARDAKARELGWPEEGMSFPLIFTCNEPMTQHGPDTTGPDVGSADPGN